MGLWITIVQSWIMPSWIAGDEIPRNHLQCIQNLMRMHDLFFLHKHSYICIAYSKFRKSTQNVFFTFLLLYSTAQATVESVQTSRSVHYTSGSLDRMENLSWTACVSLGQVYTDGAISLTNSTLSLTLNLDLLDITIFLFMQLSQPSRKSITMKPMPTLMSLFGGLPFIMMSQSLAALSIRTFKKLVSLRNYFTKLPENIMRKHGMNLWRLSWPLSRPGGGVCLCQWNEQEWSWYFIIYGNIGWLWLGNGLILLITLCIVTSTQWLLPLPLGATSQLVLCWAHSMLKNFATISCSIQSSGPVWSFDPQGGRPRLRLVHISSGTTKDHTKPM